MFGPENNGSSTSMGDDDDDDDPPPLSIKLKKLSDLPKEAKAWSDVQLPVDVLLLTVKDCEFLACYHYLRNSFKSYHNSLGTVYFGNMGNKEKPLKVALILIKSSGSGGHRTHVRNVVTQLRPKAVFSVGACTGLNHEKIKLGDVVVSSKLTYAYKSPVSRDISSLARNAADGWEAPLESPEVRDVKVQCNGVILSCPDLVNAERQRKLNPEAIAIEMEGEGIYSAVHDMKLKWVVVKGVSDFAVSNRSTHESWKAFACVMAASVVSNMLSDPVVFERWSHYEADNPGCLYAQSIDISLLEPSWIARLKTRAVNKSLQFVRRYTPRVSSTGAAPLNQDTAPHVVNPNNGINRISAETCHTTEERKVTENVVTLLDEAINFHQSDHIADARENLRQVFEAISKDDARFFKNPTKYGFQVLSRGKELFLEDDVSCSVKHGIILLDSSNSGAQFYVSLLNVVGAFAVVISEFQIAKETFCKLVTLHERSDVTSRLRDLGAAYNNTGCLSLMMGDLQQAKCDFEKSLKHLNCAEKRQQLQSSLSETKFISVKSNIARLHLVSRNFSEAVEMQGQLVKNCKDKKIQELPLQVVFTVLNNQAVLHTALRNFSIAEQELKWLISYCVNMKREDCDFLYNFVALHLSEVLLLHGKSKDSEKAFNFETLTSARGTDLIGMFGGLHINVRIEAFEKLVDVIVLKGKIKSACELLETGVKILKKSFGPDHFNVASLLYKQGTILNLVGEVTSSAEKFKCSMYILKEIFGVKHPLLLKCYLSLGDLTLKSGRTDESHLYFQRAVENIETIYQVSFVSQLCSKYTKMTSNSNNFPGSRMRVDRIEGLVAEYGLALAVLLSRMQFQNNKRPLGSFETKGKQPLTSKSRGLQYSSSMVIVSLKYTRDLLQTGQALLRQGMTKQAAAFFQQGSGCCAAYNMSQGHPNAGLARLYSVLIKKRFGKQESLDESHDLKSCLEELNEITTSTSIDVENSKSATEDTAIASVDCQLNLKLVLIFLILLSIELKMIDTTFAAYDLYVKLSQSDNDVLFFLNDGIQFYASRTSITCNGETAVQDVILSSTIGLNENDSESPLPDKQLFRNLAYKKNVPTNSFLVTYSSSVFLDIDDLQVLEKEISLSIRECFQVKCFSETGIEGSATQVVVDLTSNRDYSDVLLTGSRMELLSLCLLEESDTEGRISDISTAMFQKITRLTFADEQMSRFMFSKTALSLFQQCNSGKISTLSLQSNCLSLTVVHPVKARLTLWYKDRCVKQKIQLVQTAARKGRTDWTVLQGTLSEEPVGNSSPCSEADRFFWPAIDHWVKTYHVTCQTDVAYRDEPLDVSDTYLEQNGTLLDCRQPKEIFSQIFSDEIEQNEAQRNYLNATILENLTAVSEISRQLHGDEIQGPMSLSGDYGTAMDPSKVETSCFPNCSESQYNEEIISSNSQQTEAEIQSRDLTLTAPDSATGEAEPRTHEEKPTPNTEVDDNVLGELLFEKDRKSRRSIMAGLPQSLKKKETTSQLHFLENEQGPSDEVVQKRADVAMDPKIAEKSHVNKLQQIRTHKDSTSTSFEQPIFNPEADVRSKNLTKPWSHDGESRAKDGDIASGKIFFEKESKSRNASIANLQDPAIEEISPKLNEKGPSCEKTRGNEDSPYDETQLVSTAYTRYTQHTQGCEKTDQGRLQQSEGTNSSGEDFAAPNEDESSFVFGTSFKMAKEEGSDHGNSSEMVAKSIIATEISKDEKQNTIDTATMNLRHKIGADGSTGVYQSQSDRRFLAHDIAKHRLQDNIQELQRGTKHSATVVEMDKGTFQIEAREDKIIQERDRGEVRESNENQNKPPRNKERLLSQPMTRTRAAISPFKVEDDIVPDGPSNITFSGIHGNANDSVFLSNTDVVAGPLKRVGSNLQLSSGMSFVDDKPGGAVQKGAQRSDNSQLFRQKRRKVTFRKSCLGFLGGDVLVDGNSSDTSLKEVVDGPSCNGFQNNIQESQRGTKHTATEVEMDKGTSQIEAREDDIIQERNGEEVRESNENQDKPPRNKENSQPRPEAARSPFKVDDDIVPNCSSCNGFPKEGGVGILGVEAIKTSKDDTNVIIGNETISLPLEAATDVIDGPVYSPGIDANLNEMSSGRGGARPKERLTNTIKRNSSTNTRITETMPGYHFDEMREFGVDPGFLARHAKRCNGATLMHPLQDGSDEPYFSVNACKGMSYGENQRLLGEGLYQTGSGSNVRLPAREALAATTSSRDNAQSFSIHQIPPLKQNESWHFPPLESTGSPVTVMQSNGYVDQGWASQQNATQFADPINSKIEALFSSRSGSQNVYNEMVSMSNEYNTSIGDFDYGSVKSPTIRADQQSSTEDSTDSLLGALQQVLAKTVKLIASNDTVGKEPQQEQREDEKLGIQEEARGSREQEQAVAQIVDNSGNQVDSTRPNGEPLGSERQPIPTSVQEESTPRNREPLDTLRPRPRPVCSHYQRRCLVRFPCCGNFYPCHRCHNESKDCSDDQARAINATHIQCTFCYHEQAIDEKSQKCGGCFAKMSEYFCATCKHFTSLDKNPFHCEKCGICRIHRDRSFHCDVCNVCLDKRLQGKHKCRPDSGHDECCICLEDAFSGCQILPCSHKVHKDCAIAMIQNGVRKCPICRHPLFSNHGNTQ